MKKPAVSSSIIKEFIELPAVALVGVSTNTKKFGFSAYQELKKRGWTVYPVNPKYESVQGESCYPNLKSIPGKFQGVISMVNKKYTLDIVRDADSLGIKHIWIQQKSDSPEAVDYCIEKGMKAILGKCILMYYPPVKSIHGFHRWMVRTFTFRKLN